MQGTWVQSPVGELKISYTEGQLSLWAKLESLCHSERPRMTQQRFLLPQLRADAAKEIFKKKTDSSKCWRGGGVTINHTMLVGA